MSHKFKKGDRVQFETKFGIIKGTVKYYSTGWKDPLVRITIDSESRKGTILDAEWVDARNVSLIFISEKVEFT